VLEERGRERQKAQRHQASPTAMPRQGKAQRQKKGRELRDSQFKDSMVFNPEPLNP